MNVGSKEERMGKELAGRVVVVAGATRGAGRAIAVTLGEAGATVYCTGRSTQANRSARASDKPFELQGRPETIEETAEMVNARGGVGVAVQVDHTVEGEVRELFARVEREQGRLDILVNDVWGGDELSEWGKPFWELDASRGRAMFERAVFSHVLTSRDGVPLMLKSPRRGGPPPLVVEVTDGNAADYRGNLWYDLCKSAVNRLALAMAEELKPHGIVALAVTPGFLRSEAMLEHFGVTEGNWKEAAKKDPNFIASETPYLVARSIRALALDERVGEKAGKALSSWELAEEYGIDDVDGTRPNWGKRLRDEG